MNKINFRVIFGNCKNYLNYFRITPNHVISCYHLNKFKYICFLKVACRRIISGKWGGNNGQACVAPDYIITTKEFAPKLVSSFSYTNKFSSLHLLSLIILKFLFTFLGGVYETRTGEFLRKESLGN